MVDQLLAEAGLASGNGQQAVAVVKEEAVAAVKDEAVEGKEWVVAVELERKEQTVEEKGKVAEAERGIEVVQCLADC